MLLSLKCDLFALLFQQHASISTDTEHPALNVKLAFTSEVIWQLMVLFPTGIARMAVDYVIQSRSQQV